MSVEKDVDKGLHFLTEFLYNFFIGYSMITQFALELEYAHTYTTALNQNKQTKTKF